MNQTEKYTFDQRTQEILEHLSIPFAIYQYIDKRVVTIVLSRGFCDEFDFQSLEDAYRVMDNDMYRATHPDDKTRGGRRRLSFRRVRRSLQYRLPHTHVKRPGLYHPPRLRQKHLSGAGGAPLPGLVRQRGRLCGGAGNLRERAEPDAEPVFEGRKPVPRLVLRLHDRPAEHGVFL